MKKLQEPGAEFLPKPISRRALLQTVSAAAVAGIGGRQGFAKASSNTSHAAAGPSKSFPDKFLWGCATAGHQVESDNTSNALWPGEHLSGSTFKATSRAPRHHYHLYSPCLSVLYPLWF